MNAARVAFGLSEPAFEVEVVLRQVPILPANKQSRRKAGHDVAHRLPDGIVTLLQLRLQALKLCLTLRTRTIVRFEPALDRPDILHVAANTLFCSPAAPHPPLHLPPQP